MLNIGFRKAGLFYPHSVIRLITVPKSKQHVPTTFLSEPRLNLIQEPLEVRET